MKVICILFYPMILVVYPCFLNTRSMKFHDPGCSGAADIKAENRQTYTGSREDLIAQGYSPCGQCQP